KPVEAPEFLAAERLRDTIAAATGLRYQLDRLGIERKPKPGDIVLSIAADPPEDSVERESYTLTIGDDIAEVRGRAPEGLFHGIQTLSQIARQSGSRLPHVTITDSP